MLKTDMSRSVWQKLKEEREKDRDIKTGLGHIRENIK